MNVGAPDPSPEKPHKLDNFGTDVTREILAVDDVDAAHLVPELHGVGVANAEPNLSGS